ncbi:carbonic anhydrase [Planctomicrobium piriforme]|uniref:Carbonic anhydrase n=1 Tax=Planctomicrobium piriforme TaxID=1576369 RepID=A0A1I3BB58_9PLAN|nr:carbonic anhydrase [Planctomicrobium piriforme]SFH59514.1 carbonic anhydrase [Planctomicrobium piriforme]
MSAHDPLSRRDFVLSAGLAAGIVSWNGFSTVQAETPKERPAPDAVLKKLLEGNQRFVDGKLTHPGRTPQDFLALSEGQAPPAIVITCADSRVAPEIIFDQGIGDLFVIRVAGNIVANAGPLVKGSIEFAVAVLGARLILIMGHSQCGAVKAAIEHIEANDALPGSIGQLIDPIRPAVRSVIGQPGDKLENVTRANVLAGVKALETLPPILSKAVSDGELKIVGGTYILNTGKVELYS